MDRRALSSVAGLTLTGKIYTRHVEGSIDSVEITRMLDHLLRYLPNGFVLIWDRAAIHRSKVTRAYLQSHPQIAVEPLPPYAPEINPEEYCHGNVKRHNINARPTSKSDMRRLIDTGFRRLRRRPDLLHAFFRHAGLVVKQLWRR